MLAKQLLSAALGSLSAAHAAAQFPGISYAPAAGSPPTNGSGSTFGSYYNYWTVSEDGIYDTTRSARMGVTKPFTITNMIGDKKTAIVEPSRSALVIIDMQNYFLHPGLAPESDAGRAIVDTTIDMVHGFRDAGMKVLWVNWGLDEYDLLTIGPASLISFSDGTNDPSKTFGGDMGTVDGIEVGRKLMRGAWNSQLYGPLHDEQVAGVEAGTDLYFHKNRQSGLWGGQTPLGMWLQENQYTTLFIGGVNTDQCVFGTLMDAYFKGYDTFLVPDISATTSPQYATDMVLYNSDGRGFIANSTHILPALK